MDKDKWNISINYYQSQDEPIVSHHIKLNKKVYHVL